MNFIIKTRNRPMSQQPVHLWPMSKLLNALGVSKARNKNCHLAQFPRGSKQFSFLWDKYEEAKRLWIAKIRAAGHDFVENHDLCAFLNSVWTTLKMRFRKLGIG